MSKATLKEAKLKPGNALLLRYLLKSKYSSLLTLGISFTCSVLSGLGLGLLIPIVFKTFKINDASRGNELFDKILNKYFFFIPDDSPAALFALIISLFLLKNILYSLRTYLIIDTVNKNLINFRSELCTHLLKKDLYYYHKEGSGRILNQLVGNVEKASRSITNFIEYIGMSFQFSVYCVFLALISWQLFLICFIFFTPLIYLLKKNSTTVRELSRLKSERTGVFAQNITDTIRGIRSVKLASREQDHINWIENETKRTQGLSTRIQLISGLKSPLIETLSVFLFIGFCVLIIYNKKTFNLELNSFFTFMVFLHRVIPLFNVVSSKNLEIAGDAAYLSEVATALADKRWITQEKKKLPMTTMRKEIEIQNLNFKYPDKDVMALNSINIKIRKGEAVAIVGPSGSGKSTLCDLMLRFHNPSSGSILFDGQDIRDIDLLQFRKRVGMVSQESSLFFSTIKENVSYFSPHASDIDIWRALDHADLADFVGSLPEGLNTTIGEGGVTLSGGQKQRLSIARTLLMSPEVVIFDEATSSLDSLSEAKIVESIKSLSKGRTSITIAHRLATILHCDKIYLLEHGWIVESGTIEELLSKKSRFKKYAEAQNLKLAA